MLDPATGPSDGGRLILYAGKGGVGKTTLAAATAVRAAEMGHKALVVSTDVAHSLGDVLGANLSAEVRELAPGLSAQEINPLEEMRQGWGKLQGRMAEALRQEGVSDIQADELAFIPGMEDITALVEIDRRIRSRQFDCIVVDSAPTGETIRLLSAPESIRWYAGRIHEWRSRLSRLVNPFVRGALSDLDLIGLVDRLAERVRALRQVLTDPHRSSYRIVVTPDRMVLKEALRAETYLNVFEYPIDALVLNRVMSLPADGNRYLELLEARQKAIITEIRSAFAALPVLEAPLNLEEPVGVDALSSLARQLFQERDPTDIMHVGPTLRIERTEEGYALEIPMPNVEIEKLALSKNGDSLYVSVGTFRREITLPHVLAASEPGTARIREGMLRIPFSLAPEGPPGTPRRG